MLPFPSESLGKRIPSRFPNGAPVERYPLTVHFYLSLSISLFVFPSRVSTKGAPSMFPNRVPMGSNTPSPEPLVYFSFIHSCMSAGVPKKEPYYIHMGKNIRSLSTKPHTGGRPTYSGVRPGSQGLEVI